MEFAFEQLAGVVDVQSGYCGGTKATANYDQVHRGITGHAEAIRVTYDPDKVTYDDLLEAFFDAHDPTQLNRQGKDDVGRQYRSAIFFANDEQQQQAQARIADLESKRVYKRRIVTKLEPLTEFYPAEEYHQDFARRNPFLPYIQSHAVPKAFLVRTKHPELIRNGDSAPERGKSGRVCEVFGTHHSSATPSTAWCVPKPTSLCRDAEQESAFLLKDESLPFGSPNGSSIFREIARRQ